MAIPANPVAIKPDFFDIIAKRRLSFHFSAWLVLLFSTAGLAQKQGTIVTSASFQGIQRAPESVFTLFRQAGMKPVNRTLTPVLKEKVRHAFERLPPVHQRLLDQHLQSISFMDNMPNTALTSLLDSGGDWIRCWKRPVFEAVS